MIFNHSNRLNYLSLFPPGVWYTCLLQGLHVLQNCESLQKLAVQIITNDDCHPEVPGQLIASGPLCQDQSIYVLTLIFFPFSQRLL